MTFKPYADELDFVSVYPFAPYQFQLVQKVFEAIRRHGVTGLHLARGERSMLDAFQSAAVQLADDAGRRAGPAAPLLPLHRELPRRHRQVDHRQRRRQRQAGGLRRPGPEDPVPDPLRGRDPRQRRQPGDPVRRPHRRRPSGPAPPDRGQPPAPGEGDPDRAQRRGLLLPHQRGARHQPRDQGRRPQLRARRPSFSAS